MVEDIVSSMPEKWQGLVYILLIPISWIPGVQQSILQGTWPDFFGGSTGWEILRLIFLLVPGLVLVSGIWISIVSLYTVPFRSNRLHFLGAITMNWWDMLKGFWLFGGGVVRILYLVFGWLVAIVKMSLKVVAVLARELLFFPFRVGTEVSNKYFQPGVPWLAVILTLFWSLLEAVVFTYILLPTMSDLLGSIVGVGGAPTLLPPILFLILFLLITGSFAAIQGLVDAVKGRNIKNIVITIGIELAVMFLEVLFFYRELVDSATPWIAMHTDERVILGLYSTLIISFFGWLGIRGMTWFLFAQYGTPTILAIISRRKVHQEAAPPVGEPSRGSEIVSVRAAADVLKSEVEWFRKSGQEMIELALLPILQLVAVVVNFITILIAGEAVFKIPFGSLAEALNTSELLEKLSLRRVRANRPE